MEIACMTRAFYSCRDRSETISQKEAICHLSAAGFSHIDLHLCGMGQGEGVFCGEDWEYRAHSLREEAEKLGVVFVQSHAPFYPQKSISAKEADYNEYFKRMLHRSLRISEIVGVPNTVIHPLILPEAPLEDIAAHVRWNYAYYEEFLNGCDAAGICACFENMGSGFGASATQLKELINTGRAVHNVAACWDFGHAAIYYPRRYWSDLDQTWAIRQLKGYIRAVHVHDNWGKNDDHMLPFIGSIAWEEVLPALRETGFTGDLVLEILLNRNMPYELLDDSLALCASVSRKLIELYEGEKDR